MNLAEGVALCPVCGSLTRLATLVATDPDTSAASNKDYANSSRVIGGDLLDEDWREPPVGCRVSGYRSDVTLNASARSLSGVMSMLFFTLFWNGITSIFVLIMLAGFYTNLGGTIPAWAKNSPLDAGKNMSLGMCFFLLLFLTPFMLVGAGTIIMTLVSMFGDVRISVRGDDASASTGIGQIRWTRKFKASDVSDVSIGQTKWQQNNRPKPLIVIQASGEVRFGSSLSQRRMRWLASAAKLMLLEPDSQDVSDLLAMGGRSSGFDRISR